MVTMRPGQRARRIAGRTTLTILATPKKLVSN